MFIHMGGMDCWERDRWLELIHNFSFLLLLFKEALLDDCCGDEAIMGCELGVTESRGDALAVVLKFLIGLGV